MCSEGFTTAAFPQKTAGNAFHATFGSGVLKLMISAGDAERLAQREHGAVLHARRRRPAVGAPPLPGDEETHLDRRVGLAERELERLPGLRGDDLGRLLAPLAEAQRELAHDLAALDGGALGPRGLRRAGSGDRALDVLGARPRDAGRAACRPPAAACRATRPTPAAPPAVDQVRDLSTRHRVRLA